MKKVIGWGVSLLVIAGFIGASHHSQTNLYGTQTTPATPVESTTESPSSYAAGETTPQVESAQTDNTPSESAPAATTTPANSSDTSTTDTNLSNDTTYVNSDGNTVHSPAESTDGSVPEGATARCNDGTYSFSQHHSGTCSYHGGVAEWL